MLASLGLGAGGAGGGFGMPAAPSPVADPETAYAVQIEQLEGMGFWDRQANVQVRSELRAQYVDESCTAVTVTFNER